MMMSTLVDMTMLEFFTGRLTQLDNLYVEVQLVSSEGVVEVQGYDVAFDGIDTGIAGLALIVAH